MECSHSGMGTDPESQQPLHRYVSEFSHLRRADFALVEDVILEETGEVKIISSNVWGPLPSRQADLTLGRSSYFSKGVQVISGLMDSDYSGQIKIMIGSLVYHVFPKGTQIAQLVLFSCFAPQISLQRTGNSWIWQCQKAFWVTKLSRVPPTHYCG